MLPCMEKKYGDVLANVINLRFPDLGGLSCVILMGNHVQPPERKGGGDVTSYSRAGSVKTEQRDGEELALKTGVMQPQAT